MPPSNYKSDAFTEQPFVDEEGTDEPESYPSAGVVEREVFTTAIDPDVRTLLAQIDEGTLVLRPSFQRASVWKTNQQSKLVESLILNIPIPPLFFAEDEDGARVVVDGQQRLLAIDEFRKGEYKLTGLEVLSSLNSKYWRDISSREQRRIQQRVLRTIVISHKSDPEIRFEIFERLNTTGVPLTEQEIRNATNRGEFNSLLDELAHNEFFLRLLRRVEPDKRLAHHELVLRYFALDASLENFRPPLKSLLTKYMAANRHLQPRHVDLFRNKFIGALESAAVVFGENSFRRYRRDDSTDRYESGVSRAVYDLQMIGFAAVPLEVLRSRRAEIEAAFRRLSLEDPSFAEALSRATDHRSRFYLRMRRWAAELSALGMDVPFARRLPLPES